MRIVSAAMATCLLCVAWAAPDGWMDPCDEGNELFTDHSDWGDVLQQYVQRGKLGGIETNLVDYDALRTNPTKLRSYLRQLCKVDISTWTPEEKIALYCNAYNALIIAYVVHFNPADIRALHTRMPGGNIWKEPLGTVANEKVSLDKMEHDIVRATLTRPAGVTGRIHTCFVCASLSCPDLQMVPFEGSTLVDQLTDGTRSWLANPTKNPGPDGGKLSLSKIFDWYRGDFEQAEGSRHAFARRYSSWNVDDNAEITYPVYHWGLNAVNGTGINPSSALRGSRSSFVTVIVLSLVSFFSVAC